MADTTLASLQVIANVVVVATTLAIAALIVARINWRAPAAREPLGVAFAVVFLAIGVNAAVRTALGGDARTSLTMVVAECVMVAAMLGFLLLHRRYGVFVESAHMVREFETEFAAKDREARALAQVNEELRRLDELKSEFLAMVSHELRTPLTAIIGYSRLLMRQIYGPLTDKQLEQQEAIFRSAQRLTDLINDLLDVSQLEAGRVEIDPRPTDMRQVAEQVTAVVGVTAQAKQIQISNELAANLPAVHADPGRVHQVLLNLLSNAVKFTPVGGAVRVYGGAHKDQVWTAVEDTGVGIAPAELARIWDPFYQVESPMRSRHGGSGLGLTIVRRLVELHGGLVRAESNGPNLGSRFVFTLPIAASPALASRETTPDTLVSAPDTLVEPILAGRTVLIVEDEEHNREVMRSVVEDVLGGEALICGDGQSALGQALARQPALILLDLMLPNVSGWEVTRRLREDPRTRAVPIIAVSALARAQEREAALHAGCDAYLTKPFTPDDLVKLVTGTVLNEGVAAR
jgi:signal transduction histidine kinase/ActR/RegA family two-component response regulator